MPVAEHKLIEWGWDTPRLQDFAAALPAAQLLAFDGAVIDVKTPLDGRGLSWTLFTNKPTDIDVLDALEHDYGRLNWGRMNNNFLRLTVFPADIDWFGDWTYVNSNASAWAYLAGRLGFVGIVLDTEQYEQVALFDDQAQPNSRSLDDYTKQATQRGREFMDALEAGFHNLTVIYTFALTVGDKPELVPSRYRLLVPFVEGMAAAADLNTTLVDGYENSYIYKNPADFEQAANRIRSVQPRVVSPTGWRAPQVGFGLWIDPVCGDGGLPEDGCGFSRAEFRVALEAAIHSSDRYVWIYSQHINWYTGAGIPGVWSETMGNVRGETR